MKAICPLFAPFLKLKQKKMPETLEFPAFLRLSSMRIVGLEPSIDREIP